MDDEDIKAVNDDLSPLVSSCVVGGYPFFHRPADYEFR